MANVQIENGYTKIANEILEALAKQPLNGTQRRILDVIFRYTYGFNRKEHDLSLSFISAATICDKRQIQRELKHLECRKIIFQKREDGIKRTISFNKDYEQWIIEITIGKKDIGKSTNGEIDNTSIGEFTKGDIGEITNGTIGESTNQEINLLNKTLKKNKKENICASSAHKEVIQYFCDKHLEKTDIKYLFDGGKDGKTMQALLKVYDVEFMKSLIDWFFSTGDEFINRTGYSIGKLKISVDKYIAQIKKNEKNGGSKDVHLIDPDDPFFK